MTQISERVIDRAFVTRQHIIRRAMLEKLYALAVLDDLRVEGYERDLTHALGHAPDECAFALRFLLGMGYVQKSGVTCRITAHGIEHFEKELQ